MRVSHLWQHFHFLVNCPFKADINMAKSCKECFVFFLRGIIVSFRFFACIYILYCTVCSFVCVFFFFLDLDEMSDKGSSEHEEGDQEGSTKASSPGSSSSVPLPSVLLDRKLETLILEWEQKSRHALHYSPTRWILPRLAHQILGWVYTWHLQTGSGKILRKHGNDES